METTQVESPISLSKKSEKTDFTAPQYVHYTAKDHTTGGRDGGASRSSDGRLAPRLASRFPWHSGQRDESGADVWSWLVGLFHRRHEDRSW